MMLRWFLGLHEPQTDPSFAKERRRVSVLLHSMFLRFVSSAHTPQAWGNEWKVVSRDIPLIIMKKLTATSHRKLLMILVLTNEC